MAKKRLTAAERRAVEQHDRAVAEGFAFRDMQFKLRTQTVIDTVISLLASRSVRDLDGEVQGMVYRTISNALTAKEQYETELRSMRRDLDEAERYLADGYIYQTPPFQTRVDEKHAAFYAARQAALDVCRAFGIYCPTLDGKAGQEQRKRILDVRVTEPQPGTYFVMDAKGRVTMPGTTDAIPPFTEEGLAYRSAKLHAGLSISY